MLRPNRTHERLVALFLLGVLLFTPPLLALFNTATRVLGLPALYLYLFVAWGAVIVLAALAVERVMADADPVNDDHTTPPASAIRATEG
jgi:hypothetical protein